MAPGPLIIFILYMPVTIRGNNKKCVIAGFQNIMVARKKYLIALWRLCFNISTQLKRFVNLSGIFFYFFLIRCFSWHGMYLFRHVVMSSEYNWKIIIRFDAFKKSTFLALTPSKAKKYFLCSNSLKSMYQAITLKNVRFIP